MRDDAVYNFSPRWLEESGLPEALNREVGEGAWPVFKKLTEVEVEQNLLPTWFSLSLEDLGEWTGLSIDRVESILNGLEAQGYLHRKKSSARQDTLLLKFPRSLPVPRSKEALSQRMKERGWHIPPIHWRYCESSRLRKNEQKVLHLYHQFFGARMNDRIAGDLVAIARTFEYPDIEQIFQEAKTKKVRTLNWILNRLYQGVEDEGLPKVKRRSQRKQSARRIKTDG